MLLMLYHETQAECKIISEDLGITTSIVENHIKMFATLRTVKNCPGFGSQELLQDEFETSGVMLPVLWWRGDLLKLFAHFCPIRQTWFRTGVFKCSVERVRSGEVKRCVWHSVNHKDWTIIWYFYCNWQYFFSHKTQINPTVLCLSCLKVVLKWK